MLSVEERAHSHLLKVSSKKATRLHSLLVESEPLGLSPAEKKESGLHNFLYRAVVGQQLSVKAARTIWSRLEAASEQRDECMSVFLRPGNKLAIRKCGVSRNKTRCLIEISLASECGTLDESKLMNLDNNLRFQCLTNIWGIGPWTAEMALIFYFQEPDVWSESDISLQRGLQLIATKKNLSLAEMRKLVEAFVPYRSFLARNIWNMLDTGAI